jgi:geranylgeranyl diphosphate synthase type II
MSVSSVSDHVPQFGIEAALLDVDAAMRRTCAPQTAGEDPLLAAFDHHLTAGGRRMRARLSLTCSRALGIPEADAIALGASVELLHNASLVQDDLQDKDATRRGQPSVWSAFGRDTAIALTDLLISSAFVSLGAVSRPYRLPGLLAQLHAAIGLTVRGQVGDLAHADGGRGDVEAVLKTARQKSGPLFALALELPLITAGMDTWVPRANEAASQFGVGYQIVDDIADVETDGDAGNGANVLLALRARLPDDQASLEAERLARSHLQTARRLAGQLPDASGALLVILAGMLEQRLSGGSDG